MPIKLSPVKHTVDQAPDGTSAQLRLGQYLSLLRLIDNIETELDGIPIPGKEQFLIELFVEANERRKVYESKRWLSKKSNRSKLKQSKVRARR